MKLLGKYINFSKLLTFALVVAFFAIIAFDVHVVSKMLTLTANGVNLSGATPIATIIGVISTFGSGVIMLGVKAYIDKSGKENAVGYDSKTNTTAEERIATMNLEQMKQEEVNTGEKFKQRSNAI